MQTDLLRKTNIELKIGPKPKKYRPNLHLFYFLSIFVLMDTYYSETKKKRQELEQEIRVIEDSLASLKAALGAYDILLSYLNDDGKSEEFIVPAEELPAVKNTGIALGTPIKTRDIFFGSTEPFKFTESQSRITEDTVYNELVKFNGWCTNRALTSNLFPHAPFGSHEYKKAQLDVSAALTRLRLKGKASRQGSSKSSTWKATTTGAQIFRDAMNRLENGPEGNFG